MCRGICSPNQRQIEEPNGVFCKSISYLTSIAKTLFFHFNVSEADFFCSPVLENKNKFTSCPTGHATVQEVHKRLISSVFKKQDYILYKAYIRQA